MERGLGSLHHQWKAKAKAKGKAKSKAKAKAAPKAKASHDLEPIVGFNSTIWSFQGFWIVMTERLKNYSRTEIRSNVYYVIMSCVLKEIDWQKKHKSLKSQSLNKVTPMCFWKLPTCCAWQAKAKVRAPDGVVGWLELQISHDRLKPKPRARMPRMPRWHSWRPSPRPQTTAGDGEWFKFWEWSKRDEEVVNQHYNMVTLLFFVVVFVLFFLVSMEFICGTIWLWWNFTCSLLKMNP